MNIDKEVRMALISMGDVSKAWNQTLPVVENTSRFVRITWGVGGIDIVPTGFKAWQGTPDVVLVRSHSRMEALVALYDATAREMMVSEPINISQWEFDGLGNLVLVDQGTGEIVVVPKSQLKELLAQMEKHLANENKD